LQQFWGHVVTIAIRKQKQISKYIDAIFWRNIRFIVMNGYQKRICGHLCHWQTKNSRFFDFAVLLRIALDILDGITLYLTLLKLQEEFGEFLPIFNKQ
jgi:hypothetical protein